MSKCRCGKESILWLNGESLCAKCSPVGFTDSEAALQDANREMYGDEAGFMEDAGIDDIGAKQ